MSNYAIFLLFLTLTYTASSQEVEADAGIQEVEETEGGVLLRPKGKEHVTVRISMKGNIAAAHDANIDPRLTRPMVSEETVDKVLQKTPALPPGTQDSPPPAREEPPKPDPQQEHVVSVRSRVELEPHLAESIHTIAEKLSNMEVIDKSATPTEWSHWGPWGACDATCGSESVRPRYRYCLLPEDQPCHGSSTDYGVCPGLHDCLPDDHRKDSEAPEAVTCEPGETTGSWGTWQEWASCSVKCGAGLRQRSRTCRTDVPGTCSGFTHQISHCVLDSCDPAHRAAPVSVFQGEQAVLKCHYDDTVPVHAFHWVLPSGVMLTKSSLNQTLKDSYAIDSDKLIVRSAKVADSGPYVCMVLRQGEQVDTGDALLAVAGCASMDFCRNGGTCIDKDASSAIEKLTHGPGPFCNCVSGFEGRSCETKRRGSLLWMYVGSMMTCLIITLIAALICLKRHSSGGVIEKRPSFKIVPQNKEDSEFSDADPLEERNARYVPRPYTDKNLGVAFTDSEPSPEFMNQTSASEADTRHPDPASIFQEGIYQNVSTRTSMTLKKRVGSCRRGQIRDISMLNTGDISPDTNLLRRRTERSENEFPNPLSALSPRSPASTKQETNIKLESPRLDNLRQLNNEINAENESAKKFVDEILTCLPEERKDRISIYESPAAIGFDDPANQITNNERLPNADWRSTTIKASTEKTDLAVDDYNAGKTHSFNIRSELSACGLLETSETPSRINNNQNCVAERDSVQEVSSAMVGGRSKVATDSEWTDVTNSETDDILSNGEETALDLNQLRRESVIVVEAEDNLCDDVQQLQMDSGKLDANEKSPYKTPPTAVSEESSMFQSPVDSADEYLAPVVDPSNRVSSLSIPENSRYRRHGTERRPSVFQLLDQAEQQLTRAFEIEPHQHDDI